jgi:hypothetical protein
MKRKEKRNLARKQERQRQLAPNDPLYHQLKSMVKVMVPDRQYSPLEMYDLDCQMAEFKKLFDAGNQ